MPVRGRDAALLPKAEAPDGTWKLPPLKRVD
jgi:hypothetical protein